MILTPKFIELLEESYQWPDFYEFKFIVKNEDKGLVLEKLEGYQISEKPSNKGNYVCINASKLMRSTNEVVQIYEVIGTIKGVISL